MKIYFKCSGSVVMKGLKVLILTMVLALGFSITGAYAEEEKVTGSASGGVFNRYVFRGFELSSESLVVQPALTVSYKGFSAGFWGNIDSNEHATQSFVPDRLNKKSFNETDLTLSYTYGVGKLALTGGYIYYNTKYTAETEELFLSIAYDIITKPTLTVYQDITAYPGTYINLAMSHSLPVYQDITVDLGASAGYLSGSNEYWRTEAGTGKKYRAFHDGMVKAGFTVPIAKNLSVQPVAQYWFPLSSKAKRHGYCPNGHLDDTFVTGVNLTLSF